MDEEASKTTFGKIKETVITTMDVIPDDIDKVFAEILKNGTYHKIAFIVSYVFIIVASIIYIVIYSSGFYTFAFTSDDTKTINNFLVEKYLSILILNSIIFLSLFGLTYLLYKIEDTSLKNTRRIFLIICVVFIVFLAIILYYNIQFSTDPFGSLVSTDYDTENVALENMIKPLLYYKIKVNNTSLSFTKFFKFKNYHNKTDTDIEKNINEFHNYTSLYEKDDTEFTHASETELKDLTMKAKIDTEGTPIASNKDNYDKALQRIKEAIKTHPYMTYLQIPTDSTLTYAKNDQIKELNEHILKYNLEFIKHKLNINSNPVLGLTLIYCSIIFTVFILLIFKTFLLYKKKQG
jgi:hypothetical protein